MTFTVKHELDKLAAKFRKIADAWDEENKKAAEEAALYVHSQVPPYPGTRPGQRYRRTGTLGRSITTDVKQIGGNWVGFIGTPTQYAPWVISTRAHAGRGPQAWMHKGRWWTLQGVVIKARKEIVDIYRRRFGNLIKRTK